jgi:hypothetical protein
MSAMQKLAKSFEPPMNADERRLKTGLLSAFIGVHRRLKLIFEVRR